MSRYLRAPLVNTVRGKGLGDHQANPCSTACNHTNIVLDGKEVLDLELMRSCHSKYRWKRIQYSTPFLLNGFKGGLESVEGGECMFIVMKVCITRTLDTWFHRGEKSRVHEVSSIATDLRIRLELIPSFDI